MTPLTKTTREQEWQWQSHKQGEGKCWCVHVLCIHTHTLFLSLYVFVWSGHVRIYMNENKQKQGNNIHVLYTHGAPSSVLTSLIACTCSSRKLPSMKSVICGSPHSSAILWTVNSFSFTSFSIDSVSSIA